MPYKEITNEGKIFIRQMCKDKGDTLFTGSNGEMPFTDYTENGVNYPRLNKIWTASPKFNNITITKYDKLSEALIYWFNLYSKQFDLDANIIAAQAYAESGFILWNYPKYNDGSWNSSASGISQFLMSTVHDAIINKTNVFTVIEINKLTNGLSGDVNNISSYTTINDIARKNRRTLHQNISDNPDIMIKAQCSFMSNIAKRCNNIASSTLFGYNRGPKYSKKTYTESIQSCISDTGEVYPVEGLNYVLKIFGILGDKNNVFSDKFLGKTINTVKTVKNYKKVGYSFGYENIIKPNELFNDFQVDVNNSNM